ncbi:shikimate kinase [Curtanaerobium respiraculi]|uniref:shikimate kinase n=1 Tax=Curtanaerobium respiraculi TaxID=2949669 RepID=UPI0024B33D3E|nr:shikimate kinase [Curtanaerobium respiraculi]
MSEVKRRHAGGYELTRPVYFIGFMGAGKTTISGYLANTLSLPRIDADEYLELQEDRAIADIFAEEGEDAFRDLETKYLEFLSSRSPRFIGCGGGVVKRAANVAVMKRTGYVVFLGATAEEAASRIPNTASRPLFKDIENARRTIAERQPLYEAAADAYVDTTGRTVRDIAEEVESILLENGILMKDE